MGRFSSEEKNQYVPECGHFVHIEKPDTYFSLITAFLRR